ncbi:MAG: serine dehydratase subunit alpha family protein, partial [Oscillospiraceae bacterium]|nr:serine dehydratase subunit alpha family protein [Oscillospiraceae bacterium]
SVSLEGEEESGLTDHSVLNLADILDFAQTVDIADVDAVITRQIEYNTAISDEGFKGDWGSNVGSTLLKVYGDNVETRAKAAAAAGSDARMNGCEMPVVINSGSGNQGITTSMPVIVYAKELGVDKETLYRALVLANLVTIHQKTSIGRLSAFCGAVSAGAGAGAGIAWLLGEDLDGISHTVVNAIATTGGMVCDGAKASCATKIANAVEAAILGYHLHKNGQDLQPEDGIVAETAEQTILNVGRMAKLGMKETNEEIIKIMIGH